MILRYTESDRIPEIPPYHRMVGLIGTKPAVAQAWLRLALTGSTLGRDFGDSTSLYAASIEGFIIPLADEA